MTTIEDVHKVYNECLYLEDFHFIDTVLATYITTFVGGTPLWMTLIKPSSYGGTEQIKPLLNLAIIGTTNNNPINKYRILNLDQMTARAMSSGSKAQQVDLGAHLEMNNTFILFNDMANIVSLVEQESKDLFSSFRTLFDGYISRATGTGGVNRSGCHVNMLGITTPFIHSNVDFAVQMGSREIMYKVPKLANPNKMIDFIVPQDAEERMQQVVQSFLDDLTMTIKREKGRVKIAKGKEFLTLENTTLKNPIDESMVFPRKYERSLNDIAERMCSWRVEGQVDEQGYLTCEIEREIPKRLSNQLKKLWLGYRMLGLSEADCQRHILTIEKGIGKTKRREIFGKLVTYQETRIVHTDEYEEDIDGTLTNEVVVPEEFKVNMTSIQALSDELNISIETVREHLMILRELGYVEPLGTAKKLYTTMTAKDWKDCNSVFEQNVGHSLTEIENNLDIKIRTFTEAEDCYSPQSFWTGKKTLKLRQAEFIDDEETFTLSEH